jgi:hypothetical protein
VIVVMSAMSFPVCCHTAVTAAGADEVLKNWTDAFASLVTALAVIAGGVWAYYKFIRGRTFHARVTGEVLGQWRFNGALRQQQPPYFLHVRARVTNIGAGKVMLRQYYTALFVSFPGEQQPTLPHFVEWVNHLAPIASSPGAFEILRDHDWIEPGQTVTDDLLLDLGRRPTIAKLELRLGWNSSVWRWQRRWKIWRWMHRRALYPRLFLRNRCRPAYRWGQRTQGVRTLLCPVYELIWWRRRCRLKRRRRICRSRLYLWLYRRPDNPVHRRDVADTVRRIIPPDSTMIDDDDA